MINWKILGIICGVCAAPFTGGASLSLGMCAACAGLGFVGGAVVEKALEDPNDKNKNQTSPEVYNLLGKSLEEINKLREDLRKDHQQSLEKGKTLEKNLEENRNKQSNPNLRQPHETEEYLKNQEVQIVSELRRQRINTEELEKKLKDLETSHANAAKIAANQANNAISSDNLSNVMKNFKPSFTTKLIIAGVVILVIYFAFIKEK